MYEIAMFVLESNKKNKGAELAYLAKTATRQAYCGLRSESSFQVIVREHVVVHCGVESDIVLFGV